jgi:cell wall-associated NlpC family hydrolase
MTPNWYSRPLRPRKRFGAARVHSRVAIAAACFGVGLATMTALGPGSAAAQAAIPMMTRAEIIARAESGLGTDYTWGRESWTPDAGGVGPDCSGYALKCWEVPKTLLYQEEHGENATISPRYTSYQFYNLQGPWTALSSRSLLREGDILVKNDGTSGHVTIYAGGDAWNSPVIYEAPGTGLDVRRVSRYLGSEYRPIRRNSLSETGIVLDNPTAKSTGGSGPGGNWSRSSSVTGYYGDDYQVHAATTADAWARWTPRFATTGYHEILMRWTSASDRAGTILVTVNTPSGQYKRFINQRINGSKWFSLGQYSFKAGYAPATGSITMYATGADGYVVADAVMFVPAP